MKTAIALAACLAAGAPGIAAAATFAGGWTVSYNTADPGLVVDVAPEAGGGTTPNLEVGDSYTFNLFRIWTNETSVNAHEDEAPKPISVSFNFTDPVMGGVAQGVTSGQRVLGGLIQKGKLTWDGPLELSFGKNGTGRLSVSLADATFNEGLFGLKPGFRHGAGVEATVRYDAAPVPVPAALPLLAAGLGALGFAARRRKPAPAVAA